MLINDDCLVALKNMEDNSVDSIVTDPPAGISFMGKSWDGDKGGKNNWISWMEEIAKECLRVIKPGGHALVWAIPRTSHWTGTAWENAGWEPRDKIYFLFGTGFPKNHDISKAIDKAAGVERERTGNYTARHGGKAENTVMNKFCSTQYDASTGKMFETLPATEEAKTWEGFGTCLKPAAEEWWLLRKPIAEKTIVDNVLKYGTGAINIDGCRIETQDIVTNHGRNPTENGWGSMMSGGQEKGQTTGQVLGRFPANLILDEEAGKLLPNTRPTKSGIRRNKSGMGIHDRGTSLGRGDVFGGYDDSGSASRFFYGVKASKADRGKDNIHSTVKPTDLMRYLCKLITPPNGIILDPFMGSGSTGKAAVMEGFDFIGIELETEYFNIAQERIKHQKDKQNG